MCGLNGFWQPKGHTLASELRTIAGRMADALLHRGPDDAGTWADESTGVAFGHRRLSIADLSSAGHQPMHSANGRFVIAYNGEIYNHQELRDRLIATGLNLAWRGNSDTETLLASFEHYGVETTLQSCVGMFAFALWDRKTHTLTLARDRFGEKPLYYGWTAQGPSRAFVFGSELKALRAYPGFDNLVCREAMTQYLRFMYVPAPRSIYQDIFKLEPGCMLTVQGMPLERAPNAPLRPGDNHGGMVLSRWWSLVKAVEEGARNIIQDESEGLRLLEQQLSDAVKLQSLADVPLGAFLSGGVDSSVIAALMQRQASRPVKTFTIGFDEAGYDEAPYAHAVAQHIGTEHHEMRVTAKMAQNIIPALPRMYDEPFADASQIPTHLVCKAARQHVTVALGGDGGDELFGGYNRYFWGPRIWNRLSWLPLPLRKVLGQSMQAFPEAAWDSLTAPFIDRSNGISRAGEKVHKLAARLKQVRSIDELYLSLVSNWQNPCNLVLGRDGGQNIEPNSLLQDPYPQWGVDSEQLRMMYRDSTTYLPDDILCKVDRAAMFTSLEARVPFLDHRVVELAWRLPLHMKIRGNTSKWAIRQILYKHVPRELIERPKAGFAIPIGQWLRGPLRPWAEHLLDPTRMKAQGFLRVEPISAAWQQHMAGQDRTSQLWAVLMLQAWLENNLC